MLKFIIDPNGPEEQSIELEAKTVLIGSSDENDLVLGHVGVASHHCRIEEREGEFRIVDLSGGRLIEVDGEPIEKHAVLPIGSLIKLGEATMLFKGTTGELPAGESLVSGKEIPVEHALVSTSQGAAAGYLPTEAFIQPMTIAPERASAGMLPMLSLILSILGPVLFGIGLVLWPIIGTHPIFFYGAALFILLMGIVLGFLSRAVIRRRGGLVRDHQAATWGLYMSVGWLVVFFGVLAYFMYANSAVRRIAENEERIKKVLEDIAITQAYIKHSILIDKDEDFIGEYAALDELLSLKYSRVPTELSRDGKVFGYKLTFHNVGEDGYLVTAVPEAYRSSGRRSFSIDGEGHLRGEDIGGKDPVEYTEKDKLPKLSQEKSIYEKYKNELANDIFQIVQNEMNLAQKNPDDKEEQYRRAEKIKRIVGAIRKNFPLSETSVKLSAKLDSLEGMIDPVIRDYRANEELARAREFLDAGKSNDALDLLERTTEKYPEASNISEIKEQVREILKQLEIDAEALYEKAKVKEVEGDLEAALENYKKIKSDYHRTAVAEDIDEIIRKIQQNADEKKAAQYIADLRSLSVQKDWEKINNIIGTLERDYDMTEVFSKNYEDIEKLKRQTQARVLTSQAVQSFREKDYRAALQTFEKAMQEDPDIRTRLKKYLEECHLYAGKYALDEKEYRKALGYFIAYRRSNPETNKLPQAYLNKAYYEVGKLDYQQGNYKDAENKLFVAAPAYGRNPEFNYIYGSVLLEGKKYRSAIEAFTVSIPYRNFQEKALRKRGYARVEYAFSLEDKLRELLVENEEYQYLLDIERIKAGKNNDDTRQGDDNDGGDDKGDDDGKDDGDDDDDGDDNFRRRIIRDRRGLVHRSKFPADKEDESEKQADVPAQANGGDARSPSDYPLFRILSLIEEIEKSKDDLATEEVDAQGDRRKKERLLLKKTRMIEEFRAKYAVLKVSLDRENTNKERILNGIRLIAGYYQAGIEDIDAATRLSVANREVAEVQERLRYKVRMYSNSHSHLLAAHQNERKLQANAMNGLDVLLDQFRGWGKRMDISRSLKYAFLMAPSKEAVARGLQELTEALEIEADTEVILRSGGMDEN